MSNFDYDSLVKAKGTTLEVVRFETLERATKYATQSNLKATVHKRGKYYYVYIYGEVE